MAIAMIMATVDATKYISVGGKLTCGYGDAVGCGALTANDDSAYDGQYDSEPANVAMTVYEPSISGVHVRLYMPMLSDVAVPIGLKLPFESITFRETCTPVVFVGLAFCM